VTNRERTDLVWVHPKFASLRVRSIALLPAVTFEEDLIDVKQEQRVTTAFGEAFRKAAYRWVTPRVASDLLRKAFAGDSTLEAVKETVRRSGRVDSSASASLCAALGTDAMLSLRVDFLGHLRTSDSGPMASADVVAALVDSKGRLLWRALGSETIRETSIDPVLDALFERWFQRFPVVTSK